MAKPTTKEYFINNVIMLYDSREQENLTLLRAFRDLGVKYQEKKGTGIAFNYGDYSMLIDGKDYRTELIFERKGSLQEILSNVTASNRDKDSDLRNNLEEEFVRMNNFRVQEKWLMIEGVDNLSELKKSRLPVKMQKPKLDMFESEDEYKKAIQKYNYFSHISANAGSHIYSTLMSWQCSNRYNFKMYFSKSQYEIGVQMVNICYYYWRNAMKEKGYIKGNFYIGENL